MRLGKLILEFVASRGYQAHINRERCGGPDENAMLYFSYGARSIVHLNSEYFMMPRCCCDTFQSQSDVGSAVRLRILRFERDDDSG